MQRLTPNEQDAFFASDTPRWSLLDVLVCSHPTADYRCLALPSVSCMRSCCPRRQRRTGASSRLAACKTAGRFPFAGRLFFCSPTLARALRCGYDRPYPSDRGFSIVHNTPSASNSDSGDPVTKIVRSVAPCAPVNDEPSTVIRCNAACPFWALGHSNIREVVCECGQAVAVCGHCLESGRWFECLTCLSGEFSSQ
jgi:hypothetical protein